MTGKPSFAMYSINFLNNESTWRVNQLFLTLSRQQRQNDDWMAQKGHFPKAKDRPDNSLESPGLEEPRTWITSAHLNLDTRLCGRDPNQNLIRKSKIFVDSTKIWSFRTRTKTKIRHWTKHKLQALAQNQSNRDKGNLKLWRPDRNTNLWAGKTQHKVQDQNKNVAARQTPQNLMIKIKPKTKGQKWIQNLSSNTKKHKFLGKWPKPNILAKSKSRFRSQG